MSFSYLNNAHLKFNNNSFWFAKDRKEFNKFVTIEILIRESINKFLYRNKDFFIFDINIDIREKLTKLNVFINFKYQLAFKKIKSEDIVKTIHSIVQPPIKHFNIEKITIKPNLSVGDKSSLYFAQVLSNEMSKYISNRRIRMTAKSHISNKNLGYIIKLKGRINGNSIARKDKLQKGLISRNTLKYDIEFTRFTYIGKSGCVGIKVWINRGLLPTREQVAQDITNHI